MSESRYKFPPVERLINRVIGFIFYYRLPLVIVALVFISWVSWKVYHSVDKEQLLNASLIFTGGTIIIGIFYSIINYEHEQLKFKHDVKNSKDTLTFNTACKMHDEGMLKHTRTCRIFYEKYEDKFNANQGLEIDKIFVNETDARLSLIIVLNYFETIAIGVHQGIIDEDFMREFFAAVFRDNLRKYGTYIDHMRRVNNSQGVFKNFTELAYKWGQGSSR